MAVQISYSVSSVVAKQAKPEGVPDKLQRALDLHQRGQTTQAQAIYLDILRIEPSHSEALHLLGLIAAQDGKATAAAELMARAIEADPRNVAAYCNRATVLKGLGQLPAALSSYDRAIEIDPELPEAHFNRGLLLHEMNQWDAALASVERAIALVPDYEDAYSARGTLLHQVGRLHEALDSYDRAIELKPDFATAYHARSHSHLQLGELEQGWIDHEWRWKDANSSVIKEKRDFAQPLWLGQEPLNGKSIVLYGEQGLGDTLQFCRYVARVAEMGARVILEAQAPLKVLLAGLEGVSQLVSRGDALPAFDYQCPLMSLPLAFKTTLNTIPGLLRYLRAAPDRLEAIKARLGEKTKPRIGLAWSGSAIHRNEHHRRIPLADLIEHLPAGCEYFCLQRDVRESDREALQAHPEIQVFPDVLSNFADTAALCECMDLVITVDTSLAHLSGALGLPTWILVSFIHDWRWLQDRDDCPWYPTATVYRQEKLGDWHRVLERIESHLTQTISNEH